MASTAVTTLSPAGLAVGTPKTPASRNPVTETQTPSPGNWKHPKMAEIIRRRKASTFDSSNVLKIAYNAAGLLVSFIASPILREYLPVALSSLHHLTAFLGSYQLIPLQALRILFLLNIYLACQPLWKEPDTISDIPLTPSQRRLLGLDPGVGRLGTPKTEFVTPPKYRRSTPRAQSPAWNQSRPGSASDAVRTGRDSFSPSASPSWAQAAKRDFSLGGESRRTSGIGGFANASANSSPSRDALKESSGIWVPSTPSPSNRGTSASVGLNNKWLYERGRSSSGSRRSFGGL